MILNKKFILIFSFFWLFLIGGFFYYQNTNKPNDFNSLEDLSFLKKNKNEIIDDDEKKFREFFQFKKNLPQKSDNISLIAVGDVMLSRNVGKKINENGIDYPFLKMKDFLSSGDFVFGNLETALTPGRDIETGEMMFRADPKLAKTLKDFNFSIVSLANNHTPNYGNKGLIDTFDYLNEAGVKYVGAGANEEESYKIVYYEVKGIKLAFLAYNDSDVVPINYRATGDHPGTAFMDQEKMLVAVREAKTKSDIVIVSMHSGTEYVNNPNKHQVEFAHSAIDAGAEIVIGHHSHVVQTMEKYNGKYIFYSLGNFIFDQMWSEDTRRGLALKINLSHEGVEDIYFYPIEIYDYSQPRLAEELIAEKIIVRLKYPSNFLNKIDNNIWKVADSEKKISNEKIRKNESADLNNDKIEEKYILEDGILYIFEKQKLLWQSDKNWWIDNFSLIEFNSEKQIAFSFWKNNGKGDIKNYFSVYSFENNEFKQISQSEELSNPYCNFEFNDVDKDNVLELITFEDEYNSDYSCKGDKMVVYEWK